MNGEELIYQQIENYLQGNLKGEELTAFEKELLVNPDLGRKVELSKIASELVIENRLRDVKSLLHETHTDAGKGTSGNKILYIASGLILLGSALSIYMNKDFFQQENTATTIQTELFNKNKNTSAALKETDSKNSTSFSEKTDVIEMNSVKKDSTTLLKSITIDPIQESSVTNITNTKVEPPIDPVTNNTSAISDEPCKNIDLSANISTKASCIGEESGSIIITNIKGGTAPYWYQIKNKDGHKLASGYALPSGFYQVLLIDSKGCKETESILVKENQCPKDYSFNPFIGESWSIPVSDSQGELIMYDHSGRIYYQKELNSATEETWNGYSNNGELQSGYFIFAITYKNGTVVKGSVTIVR